tara:strand:- start:388 stop:618 length:231 start_codon:yes stop_codon:yes gene_type:complete
VFRPFKHLDFGNECCSLVHGQNSWGQQFVAAELEVEVFIRVQVVVIEKVNFSQVAIVGVAIFIQVVTTQVFMAIHK